MNYAIEALIIIYTLVVAGWWLRHVLISLIRPLDMNVLPGDPADRPGELSVVIPARNERLRIGECIRTLCAQGAVVREIIVVDDRSDDGTAPTALEAAAGDPRVRVLRIDQLPPNWAGKAHACHTGGQAATAAWILFTDADCRFQPGGLAGSLDYAERRRADFLSLWIAADHRSFWEHMLIPLCGALILYWFPPLWANRSKSKLAFANGQFILVRRAAYERIGGHACSRASVIEDIPLAAHAKAGGLRVLSALGPRIVSVRMYTSFAEIWNGWTRIFIGALRSRFKIAFSIWSLVGGSLLPTVGGPLAAWACLVKFPTLSAPGGRTIAVLLVLHVVAVYSVSYRLWGLCGCTRRYLVLYPVSVVVTIGLLARALWWMITRRPVVWRGTVSGTPQ